VAERDMGILSEAVEKVLPRLWKVAGAELTRLLEPIYPYLTKLTVYVTKLTATISSVLLSFIHHLFELNGWLIVRLVFKEPHLQSAALEMNRQLGAAPIIDYLAAALILIVSIALLISFICVPLMYKLVFKPRLKVFISFNRVWEDLAESLQKCFEKGGTEVFRVPFERTATHQHVVMHATEGIRNCDTFLCLPGPVESYVEHEVLAATTSTKPVVFLVAESYGTLPDTADKRYPIFRLETTVREQFNPLIQFIYYIGADLKSTWQLCKLALRHPYMSIFSAGALSLGTICIVILFTYCFYRVNVIGEELAKTSAAFDIVQKPVVVAHLLFFIGAASLDFLIFSYSALFTSNLVRQIRATKKARLKTIAAQFNRDDWIGIVPALLPGTKMYECLFEAAPFAHHEAV
jgi:hypothetical protein